MSLISSVFANYPEWYLEQVEELDKKLASGSINQKQYDIRLKDVHSELEDMASEILDEDYHQNLRY